MVRNTLKAGKSLRKTRTRTLNPSVETHGNVTDTRHPSRSQDTRTLNPAVETHGNVTDGTLSSQKGLKKRKEITHEPPEKSEFFF